MLKHVVRGECIHTTFAGPGENNDLLADIALLLTCFNVTVPYGIVQKKKKKIKERRDKYKILGCMQQKPKAVIVQQEAKMNKCHFYLAFLKLILC